MQNRSLWARTLAKRVARQTESNGDGIRWASMASVWAHLLLVLAVALWPARPVPPLPADVRYVERVHTEPATGPGVAGPAAPGIGDHAPGEPTSERTGAPPTGATPPLPPDALPTPPRPDVRFARTDPDDAVPLPPDAEIISAHHTASDDPRRAPVTSETPGDPLPPADGESDLPGSPTLERRPGDPDASSGNRTTGDPGPVVLGGGGGGADRPADVVGPGLGTPTEGRGRAEGGPTGGGRPGGADGGGTSGAGSPVAVTAPPGPRPDREASQRAPSWWAPMAVRIAPPSAPPGAVVPAPVERTGVAAAPVERPGRRTHTGGTQLVLETAPPLPGPSAPEPGVRRRIAAPGTADPIVELREALGFGPLDRSTLAPRPEWAGRLYEDGARDSSPQLALDVPFAWQTAVATRGTALGAYVERAEELIANRWQAADLDAHSRAVGVQGDVTVRYQVRPDGRVQAVTVVRSSGNAALDEMAVNAIPDRLGRFPRELGKTPFHHEVTLKYRNPLVSQ